MRVLASADGRWRNAAKQNDVNSGSGFQNLEVSCQSLDGLAFALNKPVLVGKRVVVYVQWLCWDRRRGRPTEAGVEKKNVIAQCVDGNDSNAGVYLWLWFHRIL